MSKMAKNKTKIKQKIESLEEESQHLKDELEGELNVVKEKAIDIGKIALGIGGGIIFSAIVLKVLFGKKGKTDDEHINYETRRVYHRFRDQLAHELSVQATRFLLGTAKDTLKSYIEKNKDAEDDDSEIAG